MLRLLIALFPALMPVRRALACSKLRLATLKVTFSTLVRASASTWGLTGAMWMLDKISSFSVVSSFTLRHIVSSLSVVKLQVQPRESRHNLFSFWVALPSKYALRGQSVWELMQPEPSLFKAKLVTELWPSQMATSRAESWPQSMKQFLILMASSLLQHSRSPSLSMAGARRAKCWSWATFLGLPTSLQ